MEKGKSKREEQEGLSPHILNELFPFLTNQRSGLDMSDRIESCSSLHNASKKKKKKFLFPGLASMYYMERNIFIYKFLLTYKLCLASIGHSIIKFFLAKHRTQERFLVSTRSVGHKVLV